VSGIAVGWQKTKRFTYECILYNIKELVSNGKGRRICEKTEGDG